MDNKIAEGDWVRVVSGRDQGKIGLVMGLPSVNFPFTFSIRLKGTTCYTHIQPPALERITALDRLALIPE